MNTVVRIQLLSSLCGLLFFVPIATANTLIGADVEGCLNRASEGGCTPFITGTWNNASATVIDPGVEFSGSFFDLNASADFFADSLVFSLVRPVAGASITAARDVSFRFTNGPLIVGFSQTGGNLTPSATSFTGNSVSFSFPGSFAVLSQSNPNTVVFAIQTEPVPEPLSAGLLSLGLLGMGRLRQNRNK